MSKTKYKYRKGDKVVTTEDWLGFFVIQFLPVVL